MATNIKLFKLNSKDLKASDWNFEMDYKKALSKGYVIAFGVSQVVEWIYEKRGINVNKLGKIVGDLKREKQQFKDEALLLEKEGKEKEAEVKHQEANKKQEEIDTTLFMHEIVQVDFSCKGHLKDMLKKGLVVNDRKYKYLVSKGSSTLTFIDEDLYKEISTKLNADRDIQTKVHAAKLSAYKSLAFTTSKPVTTTPKNVIVIPDCEVQFEADYLWVGATEETIEHRNEVVTRDICDGCCLIDPQLAEQWSKELDLSKTASAYQVRYLWTKGILFPVDYKKYCSEHGVTTIKDVWGTERNILEADVILNESMVKLWNAYESMEHWLECADKYDYGWRVGKYSKEDKWGNSNYQQLLPMDLDAKDCREFIQPQIELLDKITCGNYASAYLYLNGTQTTVNNIASRFNEDVDAQLATALMIEPELLSDKFLKGKIHSNLARTRDDMRVGHCWVESNYQIIVSDPIQLLEHLCGVENPKGILKAGEIYSKKYMDKGVKEVLAFRAPMLIENNIVKVNIPQIDEEYTEYFKYLDDVYCVNGNDLMNESLCGFDEDGDTLQLLDNQVWLRNYKPFLPVKCAGVPSSKVVVENDDQLLEVASIMLGKGVPNIGSVINIFSQLYTVRGQFKQGDKEYEILTKRLLCGQCISQATIDAKKSVVFFKVPKHWYELDACKELDDREFQESICATQKPHFFIHNYVDLKSDYIEWENKVNIRTSAHWNMSASDFLKMNVEDMSEEQVKFYNFIKKSCPINMDDKSTMKTFTDVVDEELKRISKMGKVKKAQETKHLLQYDDVQVGQNVVEEVQKLFDKYSSDNRSQIQDTRNTMIVDEDEQYKVNEIIKENQQNLTEDFKRDVLEVCGDIKVAINSLVEVVYSSNKTATLLWNAFGDLLIELLLKRRNYTVNAVVADINGDIEYKGKRFKVVQVKINKGDEISND